MGTKYAAFPHPGQQLVGRSNIPATYTKHTPSLHHPPTRFSLVKIM